MASVVTFPRRAHRRNRVRKAQITPDLSNDLSSLRILLSRFVFDERRGTFHRVSETAAFIMSELKSGRSHSELNEIYAQRYGVPRATAERDLELLLNDLSASWLSAEGSPGFTGHVWHPGSNGRHSPSEQAV
ncbi:MAG: PqqD family protein [Rhodomicrobium sp.]